MLLFLVKAALRGIYAELIEGDLQTAMEAQADGSADAILAADVFVYLGELAPLFG